MSAAVVRAAAEKPFTSSEWVPFWLPSVRKTNKFDKSLIFIILIFFKFV